MYEDRQEMRVWVCPDCCKGMDRYEHTFIWSESFIPLPYSEYDGDVDLDAYNAENSDESYDGFGLCIGCQDATAELGTGWFIEKCIVDVGFTDNRMHYRVTVQT